MARRTTALFSLSLLDLLTSALGAVIFLFIITPKGGQPGVQLSPTVVYFDTTQMKIHGELPDSLLNRQPGDTLLSILVAYQDLPKPEKAPPPKIVYVKEEQPVVRAAEKKKTEATTAKPVNKPEPVKPATKPVEKPQPKPEPKPKKESAPVASNATFRGSAPSVPCRVSFEINWPSREENVDLFVCKGNDCVYGSNKREKTIGQWDSGKSRNRLFGNDLRTNQEAVRQFDRIIPGEYKLYAQYKDSKTGKNVLPVKGIIYTKSDQGKERGEQFSRTLKLGADRTLIGVVIVKADGSYFFKRP